MGQAGIPNLPRDNCRQCLKHLNQHDILALRKCHHELELALAQAQLDAALEQEANRLRIILRQR